MKSQSRNCLKRIVASAAVVTLWKVDDAGTAAFMERFYEHLLSGQAPAAALRQAQRDLRRSERWSAPYYWAAFVLQGDWAAFVPQGDWARDD